MRLAVASDPTTVRLTLTAGLGDGRFSVRQLIDENGNLALTRSYDPFGLVMEETGSGEALFGFMGAQAGGMGLLYVGGRYYDPRTGRFLSPNNDNFDPKRPGTLSPYLISFWLLIGPLLVAGWRKRKKRKYWQFGVWLTVLVILGASAGLPDYQKRTGSGNIAIPYAAEIILAKSGKTYLAASHAAVLPTYTKPPQHLASTMTMMMPVCTAESSSPTPGRTGDPLLDASVQITLYDSRTGRGRGGIGTVVDSARRVIVTHDHYSNIASHDRIRIRDAQGGFIADLPTGRVNKASLGRFVVDGRLNGTVMFFGLPRHHTFSHQAAIGNPGNVQEGAAYQQVIRQKPVDPVSPQLTVMHTTVLSVTAGVGGISGLRPTFRLADPHFRVDEGDSGGGGFVNNLLVANTWSVGTAYVIDTSTGTIVDQYRLPYSTAAQHPRPDLMAYWIQVATHPEGFYGE